MKKTTNDVAILRVKSSGKIIILNNTYLPIYKYTVFKKRDISVTAKNN